MHSVEPEPTFINKWRNRQSFRKQEEQSAKLGQITDFHQNIYNNVPLWLSGKESTCQCRRLRFCLGGEDLLEEEMATH